MPISYESAVRSACSAYAWSDGFAPSPARWISSTTPPWSTNSSASCRSISEVRSSKHAAFTRPSSPRLSVYSTLAAVHAGDVLNCSVAPSTTQQWRCGSPVSHSSSARKRPCIGTHSPKLFGLRSPEPGAPSAPLLCRDGAASDAAGKKVRKSDATCSASGTAARRS